MQLIGKVMLGSIKFAVKYATRS